MIQFTNSPIDSDSIVRSLQTPEAGAVVVFLGVSRRMTADKETVQLTYDAYQQMAIKEMQSLETEAHQRWPLVQCSIVHRLGLVPLGEASVVVGVASAHRREAFEAGQWLIDTLKERVPIWKKEVFEDGEVWVEGPSEKVEVGNR